MEPQLVERATALLRALEGRPDALNDTTIVVAVDEGADSTWGGATEALEHDFGAVMVWTGVGAGPSNAALVSLGAQPISSVAEATTPFDATNQLR